MKAISAQRTKPLNLGAIVKVADNSGAKIAKITGLKRGKGTKGRQLCAGIGDHVKISVKKGLPEMKGQVLDGVVVRQKKEFRRRTGERISFEDNAIVIIKDEKGDPKGTQVKGPIAREITERWPGIAKIAGVVV